MATVNQTPRRFEQGGVLKIGGDTIAMTMPGTITITPALEEKIEFHDRDVPQVPLIGKRGYGEITIQLRGGKYAGTELFTALQAAASPASNVTKVFTFELQIPEHAAATTGEKFSCTQAFLAGDGLKYNAGTEFDTVDIKLRTVDDVVPATY